MRNAYSISNFVNYWCYWHKYITECNSSPHHARLNIIPLPNASVFDRRSQIHKSFRKKSWLEDDVIWMTSSWNDNFVEDRRREKIAKIVKTDGVLPVGPLCDVLSILEDLVSVIAGGPYVSEGTYSQAFGRFWFILSVWEHTLLVSWVFFSDFIKTAIILFFCIILFGFILFLTYLI